MGNAAERENPEVVAARLKAWEAEILAAGRRAALGQQLDLLAAASSQTSNLRGSGLLLPGSPALLGPYSVLNTRSR